jgi:hypothetical protein
MLGKRGILSYSAELGDKSNTTESFTPNAEGIVTVLKADFPMIDWLLKKWMMPNIM